MLQENSHDHGCIGTSPESKGVLNPREHMQVASSDFTLVDGQLVARGEPDAAECGTPSKESPGPVPAASKLRHTRHHFCDDLFLRHTTEPDRTNQIGAAVS